MPSNGAVKKIHILFHIHAKNVEENVSLRCIALLNQRQSNKSRNIGKSGHKRTGMMVRHRFAPGEEPTVYTVDICAEVGHEHFKV
jgi:hypothetical protein